MATLITGRTSIFTGISIEDYLPNEKIVVSTASPSGRRFHSARITYTDILPGAEAFDSLFVIHDFDNVIFISDLLAPPFRRSRRKTVISIMFWKTAYDTTSPG